MDSCVVCLRLGVSCVVMPLASPCIGGNVSKHFQCWQEHFSNPVLLDWIQNGIKLPFATPPTPLINTNRHFTSEEAIFVRKEIKSLLNNKCIVKCDHIPHCVSGLSVVPKNLTTKTVINLG